MVHLCGSGMGCLFLVDSRARWWNRGRDDCAEEDWDEPESLVILIWLVPPYPAVVASSYISVVECKSLTQNAGAMGTDIQRLLAVSSNPQFRNSDCLVAGRALAVEAPTCEWQS